MARQWGELGGLSQSSAYIFPSGADPVSVAATFDRIVCATELGRVHYRLC